MFDIISIGSAVVDVFLKSSKFPLERIHVGGKIEVDESLIVSGGGGTNTASGFARLGLKTACISLFGNDLFGRFLLSDLEKEKFAKKYLLMKEGDLTDYSTILVNPNGERTILIYRGKTRINEYLFPWEALEETLWLYASSFEGNVDLLVKVVTKSVEKGISVVLNPGARELKEKEKLLSIFPKIKALILNRDEADEFGLLDGSLQARPEIIVVTSGSQGARLFSKEKNLFAEAFLGKALDETGAGDAFSAGFVSGLVKGFPLEKALKLGMANGHSVVTKLGAKAGLLREGEVDAWLAQKLRVEQISYS